MRASPEDGETVILEGVPECRVVLEALLDPAFEAADDFRQRFLDRTILAVVYPVGVNDPPKYIWEDEPEFSVSAEDLPQVKAAAQRIIDRGHTHHVNHTFDLITGRGKAAQAILDLPSAD